MVPLSLQTEPYRKRYGLEKLGTVRPSLPYTPVVGSYENATMAMAGLLTILVQKVSAVFAKFP